MLVVAKPKLKVWGEVMRLSSAEHRSRLTALEAAMAKKLKARVARSQVLASVIEAGLDEREREYGVKRTR